MTGKPLRLSWGPWIFFALFGIVLLANGIMVWMAFGTWTGLETRGHYDKGRAYNQVLEAARAQDELGWRVEVALTPAGGETVSLEARFRDRDGRAVKPGAVTARLVRPTHEGYDLTLPLDERGAGRYGADFVPPLPGQWDVRILADHSGGTFQSVRRLVIAP